MLEYRPDIDGLRALAVVPVVLFHADVALFSGGFVGVDIFFVISGYLITAMLLQDIAAKRFSILDFYVRRARRLLPALLVVVTVTLLASFFLLLPNDLKHVAKAARWIAGFASNHLFWKTQTDYWMQNMLANQPLLHIWSLSVEEQFYFVIPVLLLVCFKVKQRFGVWIVLCFLGFASFAVSQSWLSGQAAAAFYLLPSRAFELLVGAILAVMLLRGNHHRLPINQGIGSIGIALIGISIFFYHEKIPFPGVAALLPCLGTAAIIYSGAAHHPGNISWVNRALKMRGLIFIGLLSYSLYLWHWPVLTLMRSTGWYAWGLPRVPVGVGIAGILLLSWASWRWVELPFRARKTQTELLGSSTPRNTHTYPEHGRLSTRQQRFAVVSALGALVLCWGLGAGIQQMIHLQPLPTLLVQFDRETTVTPGEKCEGNANADIIRTGKSGCVLGDSEFADRIAFAVLGDSHARMWTDGLDVLGMEHRQSILMLAYSSCTPLVNYIPAARHECGTIFASALDYVAHSSIRKVVLAVYWANALDEMKASAGSPDLFKTRLTATVKRLQDAGKTVYLLLDIPELDSEDSLRKRFIQSLRVAGTAVTSTNLNAHRTRQFEVNAAIASLQGAYGIRVLNPATQICPESLCAVVEGGRTLYRDKHHLTDTASRTFRQVFEPVFAPGL